MGKADFDCVAVDERQRIAVGLLDILCKNVIEFDAGKRGTFSDKSFGKNSQSRAYLQDLIVRFDFCISDMAVGNTAVRQKILPLAFGRYYTCLSNEGRRFPGGHFSTKR